MSTLYLEAAKVLYKIDKNKQGIRSALYSEKINKCNIGKLTALIYGTIEKRKEIENIIRKCKILDSNDCKISNYRLLTILIYEQLFGNLKIQGGGALANLVRRNKDKLLYHLSKEYPHLLLKNSTINRLKKMYPRYLRVNTTIVNTETVLNAIFDQMKKLNQFDENNFTEYVWIDDQIHNLIVCKLEVAKLLSLDRIPSSNELLRTGKVVLQDKGSCLSAICADISPGDIVLDACSAPGSKSLQVIDMLNKSGCLISLDKDFDRIQVLIKRLTEVPYLIGPLIMKYEGVFEKIEYLDIKPSDLLNDTGCIFLCKDLINKQNSNIFNFLNQEQIPKLSIHIILCDFLNLNSNSEDIKLPWYKYKHNLSKISKIILDPSCSGSGLPHHILQSKEIEDRLRNLSEFQTKMLIHSLTMFSSVQIVCYSTCSIFKEENEEVILNIIRKYKNELKFDFILDKAHKNWNNSPLQNSCLNEEIFDKCVFVNPEIHNCRGFFLAKFKRAI